MNVLYGNLKESVKSSIIQITLLFPFFYILTYFQHITGVLVLIAVMHGYNQFLNLISGILEVIYPDYYCKIVWKANLGSYLFYIPLFIIFGSLLYFDGTSQERNDQVLFTSTIYAFVASLFISIYLSYYTMKDVYFILFSEKKSDQQIAISSILEFKMISSILLTASAHLAFLIIASSSVLFLFLIRNPKFSVCAAYLLLLNSQLFQILISLQSALMNFVPSVNEEAIKLHRKTIISLLKSKLFIYLFIIKFTGSLYYMCNRYSESQDLPSCFSFVIVSACILFSTEVSSSFSEFLKQISNSPTSTTTFDLVSPNK